MLILGIESSCDETGFALWHTERGLLSEQLHSQIALHQPYGGVVPELASRDHIARAVPLLAKTLEAAQLKASDIDLIAYTRGPGLGGPLLVGASVAAGLGVALDKPLLGIHHLEGHLLSPLMDEAAADLQFPFIALLVSGGHTQLMRVQSVGHYELLGETLDDAAGEAFDKTGSLIGLPYPAGAALSRLAQAGDAQRFNFPRAMLHSGDLDFSFSGLKTAVLTQIRKLDATLDEQTKADVAASFQAAVVDVLVAKCLKACQEAGIRTLIVAGGVGANEMLRTQLKANKKGVRVQFPPMRFCTDNGAMIAFAAVQRVKAGLVDVASLAATNAAADFSVKPRWDLAAYSN
jgi:N6-L-threonylcarbamoyladenine synthase